MKSLELRQLDTDRLNLSKEDAELSSKAFSAYEKKEYIQALTLFEQLAAKEYVSYQLFVGWMYAQGIGVEQNDEEALIWYQKAVELGSAEALYYCGYVFAEKYDYKKSIIFFERAAEKDYSPAIYRLGVMHSFGMGVNKDEKKAMEFFKNAAAYGHVFAKREIAVRYLKFGGIKLKGKGIFLFLNAVFNMVRFSIKNLYSEELKM